jgi:hypothetical protein
MIIISVLVCGKARHGGRGQKGKWSRNNISVGVREGRHGGRGQRGKWLTITLALVGMGGERWEGWSRLRETEEVTITLALVGVGVGGEGREGRSRLHETEEEMMALAPVSGWERNRSISRSWK